MSGSVGANRIESRKEYDAIFQDYKTKLEKYPNFVSVRSTGSYVSNKKKTSFGDMDLILQVSGFTDKKAAKKHLADWLVANNITSPFVSEKYRGKMYMNTGEIITIGYGCNNTLTQIDNIIALSEDEANFKFNFLNLPAEKQGLILGLVKVSMDHTDQNDILERLNAEVDYLKGYRLSVNLSSTELSIRAETYEENSFKVIDRKVLWRSVSWRDVNKVLNEYNLDRSYKDLLITTSKKITDSNLKSRIYGVLTSMVSVKSGEVGTQKGEDKINAINLAKEILL
jgi:hypothetical protein